MFARTLAQKLNHLSKQFPVVSITGLRQSGKTTLVRAVFPSCHCVNLEDLDERDFASSDPKGFLARFRGKTIIDEVQRVPGILSYIQTRVDKTGTPGQFILTGCRQSRISDKINQTLAGRATLLHLMPLSLSELLGTPPASPSRFPKLSLHRAPQVPLERILFQGLYPRIHDKNLDAQVWIESYYRTYIERDVHDVLKIVDLSAFQNFVRLCAGRNGQVLNLSSLAADCGITHPTVRQWISVLEAGSIIYLLKPHYQNFSKRLIKSPKMYFLDSGLLCYLLRIKSPEELLTHSMKGSVFETFVISEILKSFTHFGNEPPLYFWKDRTGHEIDLIIDLGYEIVPVEIKSSKTIAPDFDRGLKYWMSLAGNTHRKGVLVYAGDETHEKEGIRIKAWYQCS